MSRILNVHKTVYNVINCLENEKYLYKNILMKRPKKYQLNFES